MYQYGCTYERFWIPYVSLSNWQGPSQCAHLSTETWMSYWSMLNETEMCNFLAVMYRNASNDLRKQECWSGFLMCDWLTQLGGLRGHSSQNHGAILVRGALPSLESSSDILCRMGWWQVLFRKCPLSCHKCVLSVHLSFPSQKDFEALAWVTESFIKGNGVTGPWLRWH